MNYLIKYQLKSFLKRFLCLRTVNRMIRLLSGPIRGVMSKANYIRLPIVGEITAMMPGGGQFIMVNDGDDRLATEIFWVGLESYESQTLSLFVRLALRSRTVLDVGANTGIFALAAISSNTEVMAYAFEPVPSIYAHLERNAARNAPARMKTFKLALSDFDREVPLYVPYGGQTLPTTASFVERFREEDKCNSVMVDVARLDSFAATHHLKGIDLIKIDTEATEHLVIKGGSSTIAQSKPLIFCEVLPRGHEGQLHQLLDPLGYKYFWITDRGLIAKDQIVGDPTLANANYLFVPEGRVTDILNL